MLHQPLMSSGQQDSPSAGAVRICPQGFLQARTPVTSGGPLHPRLLASAQLAALEKSNWPRPDPMCVFASDCGPLWGILCHVEEKLGSFLLLLDP